MHSYSLRSILSLLIGSVAGIAPALAQAPGNSQVKSESGEGNEARKAQKGEKGGKDEKGELTDSGDNADGMATGASTINPSALVGYAFAHVTTRPRRLAPGESGALVVVVALNTPAIVPGGAAVGLEYQVKQATLDLGSYAVMPPNLGTLDTKFKGQPVHDNTLTIEIPISVDDQAHRGDVPVAFSLKTMLVNGTTGQPMGELLLPVSGRVVVGTSVPRPGARDGSVPSTANVPVANDIKPPAEPTSRPVDAVKKAAAPVSRSNMTATSLDGVSLDVAFPAGTTVRLGATAEAVVTVRVPAGKALSRESGTALTLEVVGADDGLESIVSPWPAASSLRVGEADVLVASGLVSVPVLFTAASDAVLGVRNLDFRLSYRTVDPAGATVAQQPHTLSLAAVLSVGVEPTVANPWIFYTAGAALAVLLALLAGRAMRK